MRSLHSQNVLRFHNLNKPFHIPTHLYLLLCPNPILILCFYETMKLFVEVVNAHNLMPKDGKGSASPFVEVDFDNQRIRTKTVHNNLNPFWSQKLAFDLHDIKTHIHHSIEVCVYNERKPIPGRNFLGRVTIPFSSLIRKGQETYQIFQLEKKLLSSSVKGDIGLKLYISPDPDPDPDPDPNPNEILPPNSNSFSENSNTINTTTPPENSSCISENANILDTKPIATRQKRKFHSFNPTHEFNRSKKSEEQARFKVGTPREMLTQKTIHQPGVPITMNHVNNSNSKARHSNGARDGFDLKNMSPKTWTNSEKFSNTKHDLVEQVFYLFARVVKAKDLVPNLLTGSRDPYAEVRLGNYIGRTKHYENKINPEWRQVFAFSKDRIQSSLLEIFVKDKETMGRDDYIGKVAFDLNEIPTRVPPDSPLAPQWYKLEDRRGQRGRGDIMVAIWIGSQADEAFPEAWLSDSASVHGEGMQNTHSKVYVSPKLWYVRVNVVEAQDIQPNDNTHSTELFAKVQVGGQVLKTGVCPISSANPKWNEDLVFVAAEPFEECVVITIENRVSATRNDVLGKLALPVDVLEKRSDHREVNSCWFNLEKFNYGMLEIDKRKLKFSSRIHIRACLEGGYHVLDESTMYISDQRPTAKQLWKQPTGILEVGILGAKDLQPMKNKSGQGTTDPYCVAKYGQKWIRTRTIVDSFSPNWNEQYTWEVYDPCTVITLGIFDNCHLAGGVNSKDSRIGKVRIRLSTLEAHRTYTHSYPLLVLNPPGVKKMGELQVAVRFTSLSMSHVLHLYGQSLLPKLHYLNPLTVSQVDNLRHQAIDIVSARLARAEPPLRKEVVEYMLDVDSHMWSMRKSKANFYRIMSILSGVLSASKWFDDVCQWKNPITSILVHILFVILVWCPELMLPTLFLYMFLIGIWNYRHRPRHAPHMDTRLSWAENVNQDELDEEFDTFPSSKPYDVVRMRYDRLRSVAGRIQTIVGDIATQGERFQSILSWRDPRATSMFVMLCLCAAVVLYLTPFRAVSLMLGFYMLRHPRFRTKLPSVPINFFRRLPSLVQDYATE